ncbi:hypothetical protein Hamer_G004775 [Homarus americanus]|uniref:DUF659 domain-containing protein n=1 Tax=Homarus americanus TaxID=6706 RepID=A0A8J5JYT7_HOMAM|nr:hypothetical protein Hamer_G004775 [Homarus americanus]
MAAADEYSTTSHVFQLCLALQDRLEKVEKEVQSLKGENLALKLVLEGKKTFASVVKDGEVEVDSWKVVAASATKCTLKRHSAVDLNNRFSTLSDECEEGASNTTSATPSVSVGRGSSAAHPTRSFDVIEAVIATFDPEEAQSIQESKILLETEGIKESLLFIATNFACISSTITRLEERGLLLSSAISLVNGVLDELKSLQSDAYYGKLSNVLYKNKGFEKLKKVSQIMSGDAIIDETVQPLTMLDLLCMKHASIVSCDVERVFSEYKAMLTDNRRGFNFENLRHHVIIKCNHNL